MEGGEPTVIVNAEGARTTPSVVAFTKGGERLMGQVAKRQAITNPQNTVFSIKRFMGRKFDDEEVARARKLVPYPLTKAPNGDIRVEVGGKTYSPQEISAMILQKMKQTAEDYLGEKVTQAVITVPAYFNDSQRQATKDAARLADLNVFRLLNEPTAAAVAYGLDQQENQSQQQERIIAVYDLGGGTFDISILKLNKGVFEVMATGGDSALGGDDFDHAIAEWMLQQSQTDLHHQAMLEARRVKEALTENDQVSVSLGDWQGSLSRAEFDQMVDPLVKKTLLACRRALRDANINKQQVHDVVMVGGSTRMPVIREKVGAFFERQARVDIDPDKVVAIGAALQADVLAGNKPDAEMLLLDVIPLSLGLETYGGLVEKIIARNTTIPITRAQEFTTFKDDQTAMTVHVLQGERETVEENRSLAKFALKGIPPMVAGAARIKVTFKVDADGLLTVEAEEETTGAKAGIEVKPSYGLTDSEIEGMIRDSMDNAQVDMEARKLREQKVEAERTLEALDSAMAVDADTMLNQQEIKRLLEAREQLQTIKDSSNDVEEIKAAIKNMEKVAEFYVARRMDDNVKTAMAGHSVDEFDQ